MAKNANDVVITHYARTAFDKFGGALYNSITYHLLADVYTELLKRSGLKQPQISEINNGSAMLMEIATKGNVAARQALLRADFPQTTLSNNIDRSYCSGTAAIEISMINLMLDDAEIAISSGADNVGHTPFYLEAQRLRHQGFKVQNLLLKDQLLELVYNYKGFGDLAVETGELAEEMGINKDMQDQWSFDSHKKWEQAYNKGFFKDELFSITVAPTDTKAAVVLDKDQCPNPGIKLEDIAKQALLSGSSCISQGNTSGMDAGAAGLLMMTRKKAEELGLKPLAKILTVASYADDQKNSAKLPAAAISKGLATCSLKLDDLDLLEINETFAAFPLISTKVLANSDAGKWNQLQSITNVNGGAIAIGDPVSASGTRIVMTLLRELLSRGGKYGAAAICGGIGQCDAVILEAEQ